MSKKLAQPVEPDQDDDKIDQYQVEDGFRHMMEAEKVKNNPKLLKKVQAHAEKHGEALDAIKAVQSPMGKAKSTKELRAIHEKMSLQKRY